METQVLAAGCNWVPVPLVGLAGDEPLPCPLFVDTGAGRRVLFRDARMAFDREQRSRLSDEGIARLYIRSEDQPAYARRVEATLDQVLADTSVPLEIRTDVLYGVATEIATDLLSDAPTRSGIARARRMFHETSSLVLRERGAAPALRHVLRGSDELVHHALSVGLLAIGLTRQAGGSDPAQLVRAGLAGLLHDVGRIAPPRADDDPEHPAAGAALLAELGIEEPILEAVRHHHERNDGGGFPRGFTGSQIPELAHIVALVDTFDGIRARQRPRVGLFDSLRILAEVYRGSFDERLSTALVRLFRT